MQQINTQLQDLSVHDSRKPAQTGSESDLSKKDAAQRSGIHPNGGGVEKTNASIQAGVEKIDDAVGNDAESCNACTCPRNSTNMIQREYDQLSTILERSEVCSEQGGDSSIKSNNTYDLYETECAANCLRNEAAYCRSSDFCSCQEILLDLIPEVSKDKIRKRNRNEAEKSKKNEARRTSWSEVLKSNQNDVLYLNQIEDLKTNQNEVEQLKQNEEQQLKQNEDQQLKHQNPNQPHAQNPDKLEPDDPTESKIHTDNQPRQQFSLSIQQMPPIDIRAAPKTQKIPDIIITQAESTPQLEAPNSNISYEVVKHGAHENANDFAQQTEPQFRAQDSSSSSRSKSLRFVSKDEFFKQAADAERSPSPLSSAVSYDYVEKRYIQKEPLKDEAAEATTTYFNTNFDKESESSSQAVEIQDALETRSPRRSTVTIEQLSQCKKEQNVRDLLDDVMKEDPSAKDYFKSYQLILDKTIHSPDEEDVDETKLTQIDEKVYQTFVDPRGRPDGRRYSCASVRSGPTHDKFPPEFYKTTATQCAFATADEPEPFCDEVQHRHSVSDRPRYVLPQSIGPQANDTDFLKRLSVEIEQQLTTNLPPRDSLSQIVKPFPKEPISRSVHSTATNLPPRDSLSQIVKPFPKEPISRSVHSTATDDLIMSIKNTALSYNVEDKSLSGTLNTLNQVADELSKVEGNELDRKSNLSLLLSDGSDKSDYVILHDVSVQTSLLSLSEDVLVVPGEPKRKPEHNKEKKNDKKALICCMNVKHSDTSQAYVRKNPENEAVEFKKILQPFQISKASSELSYFPTLDTMKKTRHDGFDAITYKSSVVESNQRPFLHPILATNEPKQKSLAMVTINPQQTQVIYDNDTPESSEKSAVGVTGSEGSLSSKTNSIASDQKRAPVVPAAPAKNCNASSLQPGTSKGGASSYHQRRRYNPEPTNTNGISDETTSSSSELFSEGEIECRCSTSVSIGEIHVCPKNVLQSRSFGVKRNPQLFSREFGDSGLRICRKKVNNANWISYYVSRSPGSVSVGSDSSGIVKK